MAFMNLGYGRAADSIDVRALLVVPGFLWVGVFLLAILLLPETRSLVRTGRFVPRAMALDGSRPQPVTAAN